MQITKEDIDELNAVIKVKVSPEDYTDKVETQLKNYRKKAAMPGFRPGMVPAGMVKKMYGKSVLAEELNKILNDSLYKFISENKLEVLGNPLPKDNNKLDFDNDKEFEFAYEVGLAPRINVDVSSNDKLTYYLIKVDEALIDKYVLDMRKRFGKVSNGEISQVEDLLSGDFVELDAAGNIAAGGIFRSTSVFMESMKSEELKRLFVGLKPDEKIKLAADKIKTDAEYFARLLGSTAEKIASVDLQFTLKTITRMSPADLNQELFDKVYGSGTVNSEAEFRGKIRGELEKMFAHDGDHRFLADAQKYLLEKAKISLPDEFLKKYLHAVNEKKATPEQVAEEYSRYADHLKWQLIENKVLKDNQVTVTHDEALADVVGSVRREFAKYGKTDAAEEELKQTAEKILAKEEEARKVYDHLYEHKLIELFKKTFTVTEKEVSQEDFFAKK